MTDEKITAEELDKALTRFANSDLRIARENGIMSVAATKAGIIDVMYNRSEKTYSIAAGVHSRASIKAGEARELLKSLYVVVEF